MHAVMTFTSKVAQVQLSLGDKAAMHGAPTKDVL